MRTYKIGDKIRGREIFDLVHLSNGWIVLKTEDSKSPKDFRVRTIYQRHPRDRSYVPKHAHFAIDFYGKICANKKTAMVVLKAITEIWHGNPVDVVLKKYEGRVEKLPGYKLEYILYALNWILEQEDINFTSRPDKKQLELDEILGQLRIKVPSGRLGSELAISLFCSIALGQHPVNAFIGAGLDVLPRRKI
jgi:hypothetical protein